MSSTFSEHWHRIANQRVALRPSVETRKQWFRGERWYLVFDPLNNGFFRITPAAHEFLCRLSPKKTVQQVWEQCLERDPDGAPGQEEVIQLLSQLYQANLLRSELPPDTARLLDRIKKRKQAELRSFLNVMFLRFPLWDPDRFVQRLLPAVRWLFSPVGLGLWLVLMGMGLKAAVDHAPELIKQSEGVLAPGNIPLLIASMLLVKVIHEFGHAFACRRFGGEVHQMGIMLMYLSPVPYVDATASWGFRSKWQRILVSSAGMMVELMVAAVAAVVWANTGEGPLHAVAYNIIFVASVTTVLFNANPLMRYDGYYILSDLLEVPNLSARSMGMLRYLCERWLFGVLQAQNPAHSRREAVWLAVYGVLSWVYRMVVFVGIALWVGGQFLLLGALMALACVWGFTVMPVWKLAKYLAKSPTLQRQRQRAVLVTVGGLALVMLLLGTVPLPNRFRAPGILRAEQHSVVFTQTAGIVREVVAPSGTQVKRGEPLLRLESREVELAAAAARAEVARAVAEEDRALERSAAEVAPVRARRAAAEKRLRRLEEQLRLLTVRAAHDGTWVCPELKDRVGQWFPRGEALGQLVQDAQFRFSAVISQDEAANLFTDDVRGSEVRLTGQAGQPLHVRSMQVIPAEQEMLPSAALGWAAGGEVAVQSSDPTGAKAVEPFFELRAQVDRGEAVRLLQGRSGKIRVELRPEPLLSQWARKLRQLLQRKYQI